MFRIVGCAFEVIKEVGPGLHEKPYENALAIALTEAGISIQPQAVLPIRFKAHVVGKFMLDLIADNSVVIDAKVIDRITDHERGQMLNYLRITGLRVGLILNFKRSKLEWERIIL